MRLGEHGREMVPMRWGLVPFFWKKSLKERTTDRSTT
jgi:putative SOS response-associated peptidase YedK